MPHIVVTVAAAQSPCTRSPICFNTATTWQAAPSAPVGKANAWARSPVPRPGGGARTPRCRRPLRAQGGFDAAALALPDAVLPDMASPYVMRMYDAMRSPRYLVDPAMNGHSARYGRGHRGALGQARRRHFVDGGGHRRAAARAHASRGRLEHQEFARPQSLLLLEDNGGAGGVGVRRREKAGFRRRRDQSVHGDRTELRCGARRIEQDHRRHLHRRVSGGVDLAVGFRRRAGRRPAAHMLALEKPAAKGSYLRSATYSMREVVAVLVVWHGRKRGCPRSGSTTAPARQ